MVKEVSELIKEATEAVKDVPEALKEIAFSKAFDALVVEQNQAASPRTAKKGKATRPSTPAKDGADLATTRKVLDRINRTDHPEITHRGTALANSLRVLAAVRDDLDIDGLSASDIAHLLTDKFRCKITRQAVSMALNDAGRFVNRVKDGRSVIFQVMSGADDYLARLSEDGPATAPPKVRTKKKKKEASKPTSANPKRSKKKSSKSSRGGTGAFAAFTQLYDSGFFSSGKTLRDIIEHLKENLGRTFKSNEMSPQCLRYLRDGKLKRKKNSDNQYEYQNV